MTNKKRQHGSTLITSLTFIVVLAMLVAVGMRTSIVEEKMAANARDMDVAFQAAEAALRAGEQELNGATLPTFASTGAYLSSANRTDDYWLNTHNWATNSIAYGGTLTGTSSAPRYVIEDMPPKSTSGESLKFGALTESGVYKITVRGTGSNSNSTIYLQATYIR